jgi:radical SAM superfamily enzyme YgiQ (UPF0313 family)
MAKYYIVYGPPIFNLMALFGKISHPKEVLAYMCNMQTDLLNGENYLDYLQFEPRKQKVSMAETLAMECYTLTYLANMIAKRNGQSKIFLSDGKRRTIAQIINAQGQKPAAVFISAMSANFPTAVAAATVLNHGRIPVIIGGIHVSTSPEDVSIYLRKYAPHPNLIAQVIGPADGQNISQILHDLEADDLKETYYGKNSLEDGIWGADNVVSMAPLKFNRLKRIPFIGNVIASKVRVNVAAPYLGCPNSCRFCSISTLPRGQRTFTIRETSDFMSELMDFQKEGINSQTRFFFLLPDNLLLGGKKLEAMLDRIIDQRMNIRFAAQISIDVANNLSLLRKLRQAGATHFFIGFESLDVRNLAYIGKHIVRDIDNKHQTAIDYYRRQLKNIDDFGITVHGSFIFGLPYDYFNSLDDNTGVDIANFCMENHIGLQPCSFTDLPGSINYKESQKEGNYLYGRHGTPDYLVGLCVADLSETNRKPFDSLKNSPLLAPFMAYLAIQRVGAATTAIKNGFYSMAKAFLHPCGQGSPSLLNRLEDGAWAFAMQLSVSQYKDHADLITYTRNGVEGTFQRLYRTEKNPEVRRMLSKAIAPFCQ